jgi:hypothetical protein
MDQLLHCRESVIAFFAALVVAACATSVTAQHCGDGAVAHAVQVKFADCGDVPDDVSVYIGSNIGELLPLTKSPSGYWEADYVTFEPTMLALCLHTCSNSKSGCARFREMVAIDRGSHHGVCAARYVIRCTEPVWKLHVETEPETGGWIIVYKRLRRTPGTTAARPPFDLCDLAYDEQVEFQLQGIPTPILLKLIYVDLFERGQTIEVNRDELARGLQTALKRTLSAKERDLLPKLVTFKVDR